MMDDYSLRRGQRSSGSNVKSENAGLPSVVLALWPRRRQSLENAHYQLHQSRLQFLLGGSKSTRLSREVID
jgi:hypothetical protein